MKIVVCIKQVPNTTDVRINPETNTLIREGVESIINPFDMYAIEEGIRLKEKHGGETTVLTMGAPMAESALREAISLGVDKAVLLTDRAFAGADTWATAYTLAAAIDQLDGARHHLMRQAGDRRRHRPGRARPRAEPRHPAHHLRAQDRGDRRWPHHRAAPARRRLPAAARKAAGRHHGGQGDQRAAPAVAARQDGGQEGRDHEVGPRSTSTSTPSAWASTARRRRSIRIFTPPRPKGGKVITGEPPEAVAQLLSDLKAAGIPIGSGRKETKCMDENPIRIVAENCTGCKACEKACPYDAIHVIKDAPGASRPARARDRSTTSAPSAAPACAACKFDAIIISRSTFEGQNIATYSGICVFAEHRFGRLASVVPEIIERGAGAEKGPRQAALRDPARQRRAAAGRGADLLRRRPGVDDRQPEDRRVQRGRAGAAHHADPAAAASPEIFLGGGTIMGRSCCPAWRRRILHRASPPTARSSRSTPTRKLLRQTRPAFGGNIMATILCRNHGPRWPRCATR